MGAFLHVSPPPPYICLGGKKGEAKNAGNDEVEEEEEEGTMMRALEAPWGLFLSLLQGLLRFDLFHPGGHIEMALVLVQFLNVPYNKGHSIC